MFVTLALLALYLYFGFASHTMIDGLRGLLRSRSVTQDDCPPGWPLELAVRALWTKHLAWFLCGAGGVISFLSNIHLHSTVAGAVGFVVAVVLWAGSFLSVLRGARVARELREIDRAKERVAVATIKRAVA